MPLLSSIFAPMHPKPARSGTTAPPGATKKNSGRVGAGKRKAPPQPPVVAEKKKASISFSIPRIQMRTLVNAVKHCLPDDDEKRKCLHGILFVPHYEGSVDAIASDGKTLARMVDFDGFQLDKPFFLPEPLIKPIIAGIRASSTHHPEFVLDEHNGKLTVSTGIRKVSHSLPTEPYPDYASITPGAATCVTIKRNDLLAICVEMHTAVDAYRKKCGKRKFSWIGDFNFKGKQATVCFDRGVGKTAFKLSLKIGCEIVKPFSVMLDLNLVIRALQTFTEGDIFITYAGPDQAIRFDSADMSVMQLIMSAI